MYKETVIGKYFDTCHFPFCCSFDVNNTLSNIKTFGLGDVSITGYQIATSIPDEWEIVL